MKILKKKNERQLLEPKDKKKYVLMILFTYMISYITLIVIYPSSYWEDYFSMPSSWIVLDLLSNLLVCISILTFSQYIDRNLDKKISWMESPIKRLFSQIAFQILGVIVLVIVLVIVFTPMIHNLHPQSPEVKLTDSISSLIAVVLWALMISAVNTGDYLLRNWRNATVQAAAYKIKAAVNKQYVAEAELEALRLQLDPHFMFNNLSVLSELILKDQKLGYEYTENFTSVYRYLLTNSRKKLISLRDELGFVRSYLSLIQHRMGNGVIFRIDVDDTKLDMQIPPMTLQLFIENALKHNRVEEEDPLIIHVFTNSKNEIVVTNNLLPKLYKSQSTGIGLKNIFNRYSLLSDLKPYITADEYSFTITVPLI